MKLTPVSLQQFILTLLITLSTIPNTTSFQFASITVQPDSKTINTLTRYKFTYDRTQNDNVQPTPYTSYPITSTDTVTITFPTTYTLSSVSCTVSVNGGTQFTPGSCVVSGSKVIVGGIVGGSTVVGAVVLYVGNVVNPVPAIVTDYFYGTIGSDVSGSGYYASSVILQAASFISCYVTFNTSTVNSTSDMILTIVPRNTIGSAGSIKIQFPTTRRWSNDISTTNMLPISTSMSCSNKSANVKSTFQCVGDTQAAVYANYLFDLPVGSVFSFSVNNFLSPPTQQPTDVINITSYISGSPIDTCLTYPSGLTPKIMTGTTIASSTGTPIIINRQYSLRFSFTLPDTLAQNDTLIVTFPAGTQLTFSSSNISSNFSVNPNNASYDSVTNNMYLYMLNQGRTFGIGTALLLTIGSYTAPPSIQPTADFVLTFYRNGWKKIQGTTTLVATASTLSGTAAMTTTSVNAVTTYTFTITTLDPVGSTGRIKIVLPSTVSVSVASPSCATLTGTSGVALNPVCSFNTIQNSITLSSLNSSSSPIPPQTLTLTITNLKNPPSTQQTSSFSISTYYKSTDASLVATGTIVGVTATTAIIDPAKVSVSCTSDVVNDQAVTYSVGLVVSHFVPAGGYFLVFVPGEIGVAVSSISGHCFINVNSTSYVPTVCTASTPTNSTGNLINFTNPFTSDLPSGSTFIARISTLFTNPSSTRPTSSFGLYTFHSNGFSIASIQASKSVQMNTSDSFQSLVVTRSSHKNYQINSYSFIVAQRSPFQASSVINIGFPAAVVPINPTCVMNTPVSATLNCSYTSPNLRVVLPATSYSSGTVITITVGNVRNPPSFAPCGTFSFQTRTPGQLYIYSRSLLTPTLYNNITTSFQSLTYEFIPPTYGQQSTLKITFDPSQSGVIPTTVRLTLANSFTVQALSCNSFDFAGTCSMPSLNTVEVSGSFISGSMIFSVGGFVAPLGPVGDYSSLVSFDAGGFRLDQSSNNIRFVVGCTLPCKTCQTGNTSSCTSCYNNTVISTSIYYDSTLKYCYQQCPDGRYQSLTPLPTCLSCDSNCLTCQSTSTFCTQCNTTSLYKYLHINTTTNTQRCVSVCPSTYYPDSSFNPVTCKACVSPCRECTGVTACTSCANGFYYYGGQCLGQCPAGIAINNNSTNNCDFCDANCLTCAGAVTTCTSCNQTLLLYLGQCRTSCPSPMVPQNGTCGGCDTSCKTCSTTRYNCTSCDTNSSLAYLYNNLCLSQCPETYYKNLGAGLCSLCSSVANLHCRNCSTVSTCFSCDVGYVYYLQTCLDYVPNGFVNVSGVAVACVGDCLTCSVSPSNCTSCTNYNFYNYQCLPTCPTGYLPQFKICKPCLSPCRTCTTTISTCTSCLTNLTPSVFYWNNQCVETCPNGMYPTQTNYSCLSCVTPCQYCSSISACTSCLNGFYLSGNSCGTVCPTGYTGVDRVCQVCLGNCATCTETTTKCTSCKPDTYFLSVNNSCVGSCGTGLFIDYLTRSCVTCSPPCKTCTNTSDTCLSCTTGILYNNGCLNQCPQKYFVQSGQCYLCPGNCSSCLSLIVCTGCAQNYVLYNGFCITECPPTDAVVINSQCTKCSTVSCHKCTSADYCINCQSKYSLLNGACLSQCPSGYTTNGTHCIDTNKEVLTTKSASFPVPFSIATAVIVIACLMSKLQFQHTFMSGAIYALIGVVEWAALGYFLYLYFIQYFISTPLPFLVGGAAMAYLYLLNFLALLIQNCTLCYDRHFRHWFTSKPHKCITILVNFFSTVTNHKFRNILFCKMFTLDIFTAQLESNQKFKVINVFSFLSLLHSGAAIFAAVVAIQSAEAFSQFFYACVDVIVATGINSILAFFNVMKPEDFFYQRTAEGFELKKRISIDDDYYQSKIEPEGKAGEDEEGFATNLYRTQVGAGFTTKQLLKIQSNQDISDKDYSFGSLMEKNVEEVSIQAVQALPNKQIEYQEIEDFTLQIPSGDQANPTPKKPLLQSPQPIPQTQPIIQPKIKIRQTSIQASPILQKGIEQRLYNIQIAKQREQRIAENQSKMYQLTRNNFKDSEKDRKKVFDSSSQDGKEISKNILYKPDFQSRSKLIPGQESQQKKNQPVSEMKETGVGSYRPIEFIEDDQQFGVKAAKKANQKDQGIQMSTMSKKDEGIQQNSINKKDEGIQSSYRTGSALPQQQLKQKNPFHSPIIEEQQQYNLEATQKSSKDQKILQASQKNELILPKEDIQEYQRQLQQRVATKNQQLQKIKQKIQTKQQNNSLKSTQIAAGRLYRKSGQKSVQQPDKTQEKQILKVEPVENVIEEIEVIDHIGDKKVINVQFNDRESKHTEEDFMGLVEDHREELIFQEVQDHEHEDGNGGDQVHLRLINKNTDKNQNQRLLQPEIQQVAIKQSEGEITSANDASTKLGANANRRGGGETDGTLINVDEIDQSIDEQSEGIHEKPVESSKNLRSHVESSELPNAGQTNQNVRTREFGEYSHRPEAQSRYNKNEEQKNNEGRISTPLKQSSTLEAQPRKNPNKMNPLLTINRFEFENEDRNKSQSGQDDFSLPFRARLQAPFETDKEQTQFKNTGVSLPQKIVMPRTNKYNTISADRSKNTEGSNEEYEYKVSPNKRSFVLKMQSGQSPLKSKKYDMQFGPPDREEEPYIEQSQSGYDEIYKKNTNSKLVQQDDELMKYYSKDSTKKQRSKSKRKQSQSQLHAQKIYMQRQDVPRKKK